MVSIVMPAYNEADIIERSVREWYDVISRLPGSELIVVDDCSTDGTGAVLARLAAELPDLRPLRPARNGGHGRALRRGFEHATKLWVFQTDSDRQHLPSEFWALWERRDGVDFVLGVRSSRADGTTRVAITTVMRLANALLWGLWIRDANCPFKLMHRDALMKVLARIPRNSFIPMVMVSIVCRKMRFAVAEVEVRHLPRRGGEQSLHGLGNWVTVGARCLRQLVALRLSFLGRPR